MTYELRVSFVDSLSLFEGMLHNNVDLEQTAWKVIQEIKKFKKVAMERFACVDEN